jgi:hypothetical protein
MLHFRGRLASAYRRDRGDPNDNVAADVAGCEIRTLAEDENETGRRVAKAAGCDSAADTAACPRGMRTHAHVSDRGMDYRSFRDSAGIPCCTNQYTALRRRAALELLEPIYAWFNEGFEIPALRDARSLLIELSKPD